MRRYFPAGFGVLLCCLVWLTPTTFSQESPPPLNIELKLVSPRLLGLDDRASTYPGSGLTFAIRAPGVREIPVKIETRSVALENRKQLEIFLSENGIRPDNQALSFVYYLNPELASVDAIDAKTTLLLPVFRVPTIDRLPKQPIVALTIEPKLREELRVNIKTLTSLTEPRWKHFSSDVQASFGSVKASLNEFSTDGLPISREALVQMTAQLVALNTIVGKYPAKSRVITLRAEDSSQLEFTKTDLMEKVAAFSRQNPNVVVVVKTLQGAAEGKREVSNYIICYVPKALYKENLCSYSFYAKSSPTAQPLTVARYIFWAIKPGDQTPASDVRLLQIREPGTVIELTIK